MGDKGIKKPKLIYLIGTFLIVSPLNNILSLTFLIIDGKYTIDFLAILILFIPYASDLFAIIASIGLMRFKIWGRICLIAACIINCVLIVLYEASSIFWPDAFTGGGIKTPIFLLIYLLTIWYLFRPKVKETFIELNRTESPFRWH